MNPDPDYSAAYVVLRTDAADGLEGHGLTFTIGRGNELCVAAASGARAARRRRDARGDRGGHGARSGAASPATASCAGSGRRRASSTSRPRAVVNAVWDLWAKARGQAALEAARRHDARAARRVHRLPLHHRRAHAGRGARDPAAAAPARATSASAELRRDGYPAYTTSAGWLGYSDEKMRRLCREAIAAGLDALQDQGRPRPRRRRAPRARSSARRSAPTAS